jgi:hypothetical protein
MSTDGPQPTQGAPKKKKKEKESRSVVFWVNWFFVPCFFVFFGGPLVESLLASGLFIKSFAVVFLNSPCPYPYTGLSAKCAIPKNTPERTKKNKKAKEQGKKKSACGWVWDLEFSLVLVLVLVYVRGGSIGFHLPGPRKVLQAANLAAPASRGAVVP